MTYLADTLHSLSLISIPRRNPVLQSGPWGEFLTMTRDKGRDLKDRALYTFGLSALNAAADLRIDTPERLERLANAVLDEPRQLFIEANLGHLNAITQGLRGFFDTAGAPVSTSPDRWGAFVDILGEGRMRFQTLRLLPDRGAIDLDTTGRLDAGLRKLPAQLANHCRFAACVGFDADLCNLDIHRRIGVARREFEVALERVSGASDPVITQARNRLEAATGVRERQRILDMAWRTTRFRDLLRMSPDPDINPDNAVIRNLRSYAPSAGHPALIYGLPIIAMLAVLEANGDDIRAEARKPSRESRATRKKHGEPGDLAPGLQVVTLNLADQGLQSIYEHHSAGAPGESNPPSGGTPRARHPVRGHLFVARNGRLTWRRPHWRGSLDKPALHRVIARREVE